MNGSLGHYPRGRAEGWALPWPATVSSQYLDNPLHSDLLPGNIERWKYFVKLKWVLDRTKRRAFAVLSSSDSYSLCRFSKAGNTAEIWTLWPSERLTNSRLLKSWAGGMEVISFNYSVFVSYLTNVYGVGDWSDQIKKFQITLTRKSPVGWGLGRPHDLNMESRGHQGRGCYCEY